MSLQTYSAVFDNANARARLKAAMRIQMGDLRAETLAADATPAEELSYRQRKELERRWSLNFAYWLEKVADFAMAEPGVQAIAPNLVKLDEDLAPAEVAAVDAAVVAAVEASVSKFQKEIGVT